MTPIWRRKEPASLPKREDETPLDFCDRLTRGFSDKAHHNKRESLVCFVLVLVATLTAPLFIGFGQYLPGFDEAWTRLVPAVLSVLAAGLTAWLQLRKPQQLWVLYRHAQRRLEDARNRHRYQLAEYAAADRDRVLAQAVADIAFGVHQKWMPMVPSPEALGALGSGQVPGASREAEQ